MKTKNRLHLIDIIKKFGPMRPADLAAQLEISPQALHRHLKRLSEEGLLEPLGKPPFTRYSIAGTPDFSNAFDWIYALKPPSGPLPDLCETRDVLSARLPRLRSAVSSGLSLQDLPLVIAYTGEIANNSFDHNLGQWRDISGCWLESRITGGQLWVFIGDRGQGVFQSLSRAHPSIVDDQSALESAFERIISGRSPEQRGNGLKFVRAGVVGFSGRGLACASGVGRVSYGGLGSKCAELLAKHAHNVQGTLTLLAWSLK